MSGIAIYVEGGGHHSADGKAALRQGFGEFFSQLRAEARRKGLKWKIVACGSRDAAFKAFTTACGAAGEHVPFLLVDSEGPVLLASADHLAQSDHWQIPAAVRGRVHLMVQVMETWFIADRQTLSAFYGDGFLMASLPRRADLENVPKQDVERSLARATRPTQKGAYHKVRHAEKILALIDANIVRLACPSCEGLFKSLEECLAGSV